jgi:hypothetical protein
VEIMRRLGLEPDPWQVQVLESQGQNLLLNCCRQAGKSTVVAVLALVEAMFKPRSLVLLLSRSHRQSAELFRLVARFYTLLGCKYQKRLTTDELELTYGSRILSLPCSPETVRGYANVRMLVIDEAAQVPDELYRTVRPMLAVSQGRMICLSTPYGKRGFFWDAWARGSNWLRIEVPASKISRIAPETLEEERRALGESFFRQEYCCSFEAQQGLVYPHFARCLVPRLPDRLKHEGKGVADVKRVGGIDFGYHNPFAAVWGVLDAAGVLWLTGEHYERQRPLSHHVTRLPKDVRWFADPSGATEISELRVAGFAVSGGDNSVRPGIAAVAGRIESGGLWVMADRCPNLLAEAGLYRYSADEEDRGKERPLDENNYALDALRYLVSRLDARYMARPRTPKPDPPPRKRDPWLRYDNEELWTRIF